MKARLGMFLTVDRTEQNRTVMEICYFYSVIVKTPSEMKNKRSQREMLKSKIVQINPSVSSLKGSFT